MTQQLHRGTVSASTIMEKADYEQLEKRIGRIHLKQRLGIESDYEAKVFGQGINFFHIENWYSIHSVIRNILRFLGLHGRGRRNALDLHIRHNDVFIRGLPKTFDGYPILHITDLHIDMNSGISHVLIEQIRKVTYDVCVITGDIRARTFGPYDNALEAMSAVRVHLKDPVYGILGNHDTIKMVPGLESLGIRMLLNESVMVEKQGAHIYLAGIDDPHYYCVDNIEKAAHSIPADATSILLSHSPEVYKRAAHSDFDLMLCGHTHHGQICLPGGIPIMCNARCPRHICAGVWKYHDMAGYTSAGSGVSVVDVRLNCPPEITLHHLRCGGER